MKEPKDVKNSEKRHLKVVPPKPESRKGLGELWLEAALNLDVSYPEKKSPPQKK